MKTMFENLIGKPVVNDSSCQQLRRLKSAAPSLATVFVLVSMVAADLAEAKPPELSDAPSYAAESPMTIAALFQAEETEPQAEDPNPRLDDRDSTLRDALEMLSDKNDQNPREEMDLDPVDEVTRRSLFANRETKLVDGRFSLPPISALTTGTSEIGNGELPLGFRQGEVSPVYQLPESGSGRELPWQWNSRIWAAANTFSHPLFFEDRMLERHGHQRFPYLQPFVSGGRFAAQAVLLPYLSTVNPPCECQYTLGYYRAGNCVPALKQRPPYVRKGLAAQAAAVVTTIAILP